MDLLIKTNEVLDNDNSLRTKISNFNDNVFIDTDQRQMFLHDDDVFVNCEDYIICKNLTYPFTLGSGNSSNSDSVAFHTEALAYTGTSFNLSSGHALYSNTNYTGSRLDHYYPNSTNHRNLTEASLDTLNEEVEFTLSTVVIPTTGIALYILSLLTLVGNAMVLHAIRTDKRLQTVRGIKIKSFT